MAETLKEATHRLSLCVRVCVRDLRPTKEKPQNKRKTESRGSRGEDTGGGGTKGCLVKCHTLSQFSTQNGSRGRPVGQSNPPNRCSFDGGETEGGVLELNGAGDPSSDWELAIPGVFELGG